MRLAVPAPCRLSHSFLTNWPDGTGLLSSLPDTAPDADQRIRTPPHLSDPRHLIYGTEGLARLQLTATATATAATNGIRQRSPAHANTRTFYGDLGIRPA